MERAFRPAKAAALVGAVPPSSRLVLVHLGFGLGELRQGKGGQSARRAVLWLVRSFLRLAGRGCEMGGGAP
jgi:hypothetical protein